MGGWKTKPLTSAVNHATLAQEWRCAVIETGEFVAELHRRRVTRTAFAAAHGLHPSQLSHMLQCPALPDEFMETLDRIAPVKREEAAAS